VRHISIRSLMAFVVVAAVGLAALRNPNEIWAGIMPLLALAAVGTALLGAIILRGQEQYWWLGFAFFSGGYLALALGPWQSETVQPQLGTTYLLNYLRTKMANSQLDTNIIPAPFQGFVIKRGSGPPTTFLAVMTPFQRVGHSLFSLLAGLLGGTVANLFYARRKHTQDGAGRGSNGRPI
jgi:hypothetical protein